MQNRASFKYKKLKGAFFMNTVEKAEKMIGKINNRYNLTCKEMEEMYQEYNHDIFNLISCAFRFGYLQGSKAVKAEMRKEKVA